MEEDTRDKLTEKFFRKSYPNTLKKKDMAGSNWTFAIVKGSIFAKFQYQ